MVRRTGGGNHGGDPLLSIETEKTTVDIEAPCSGYLTNPLYEVGEEVEVGTVLVYVADTEEEAARGQRFRRISRLRRRRKSLIFSQEKSFPKFAGRLLIT